MPAMRRDWKGLPPQAIFAATLFILAASPQLVANKDPAPLRFNRDVRPILSAACFRCHGADGNSREAELRLDERDAALKDRGDYRVISPGKPSQSELQVRITTDDEELTMPPPDESRQLSEQEVQLLLRWIKEGAQYERHWAFIRPTRAATPRVARSEWPRNAIDDFVLAQLERRGMQPSLEADKAALIRRVTLDLTGLPPTLDEIDRFLADRSAHAYEKVIDRLLNSEQYGEHMTRYWLDAARYADTNGFFTDDERSMWQWRDWVIRAFNDNMRFDQFTVEQLAGDLLPNASLDQRIASGFNRNHMTTHETGVIDEEYRVEYVVDRLETTSTTWLGLTVGCARCHDHKYDPISQTEYYRLFAFFNNGPIKGNTGGVGNAAPVLEVPSTGKKMRLAALRNSAAQAKAGLAVLESEHAEARSRWEQSLLETLPGPPTSGLVATMTASPQGGGNGKTRPSESEPGSRPRTRPGLLGQAAHFDGDAVLPVNCDFDFGRNDAFSLGVWIRSETGGPACVLSKNDDVQDLRGVDVMLRKGKLLVHLVHRWNSDAIQVMTSRPIRTSQWQHLGVTYDGSGKASGVTIYVDGLRQEVEIRHDSLRGDTRTNQPLRIGRRSTSAAYKGLIERLRVFDRRLSGKEMENLATSDLLRAIVGTPAEKRTAFQQAALRRYYLAHAAPERLRTANARAAESAQQLKQLQAAPSTTMVMQEQSPRRETFVLMRGQYDQHGEKVAPGVPSSLPPLAKEQSDNRLGLARWLVSAEHPLTARVAVNRYWRQYFGTGLVKTVGDFGVQGEWPSHPDLLDWLAVEFISSGWNIKHLQRLIVTSASYRQTSKVNPKTAAQRATDPENRWLSRGPRFRLDAESVRDNALSIGGLLVDRRGGKSVKPYQPSGLWKAVSYDGNLSYLQDHGDALYRRSLYTYWKRQSPPPSMLVFDAPTRETCTVRRPRTNTPLQALALMNGTAYVEAARALAQRMMTEPDASASATTRIQFAFRLATAREAAAGEEKVLLELFEQQLEDFQRNKRAAKALLGVGESKRVAGLDISAHAAWTTVASVILNLDETLTKQ